MLRRGGRTCGDRALERTTDNDGSRSRGSCFAVPASVAAGHADDSGGRFGGGRVSPPVGARRHAAAVRRGHAAVVVPSVADRHAVAGLFAGRDSGGPRVAAGRRFGRDDPGLRLDRAAVQSDFRAVRADAVRAGGDRHVLLLFAGDRDRGRAGLGPVVSRHGRGRSPNRPRSLTASSGCWRWP